MDEVSLLKLLDVAMLLMDASHANTGLCALTYSRPWINRCLARAPLLPIFRSIIACEVSFAYSCIALCCLGVGATLAGSRQVFSH